MCVFKSQLLLLATPIYKSDSNHLVVDTTLQDFHVFSVEANAPWHRDHSLKEHWQANIPFEGS